MSRKDATTRGLEWLSSWLVRAVSRMVPRALRSRWLQEWEAEIAYRARHHREPEDALALLRSTLGSIRHAASLQRQEWGEDLVMQDLRYALRGLTERPLFLLASTLTLAVGISANTALFSVIDSVLLRPLPFSEPERLVWLNEIQLELSGTIDSPSPGDVMDWSRESESLEALTAWYVDSTTLLSSGGSATEEVPSARVAGDFFEVFAMEPVVGRTFAREDISGEPRVAVLSYELWQRRYGGREDVVGSSLPVKSGALTIVGVMPSGFRTPATRAGEVQLFKPWDLEHTYRAVPGRGRDHRFVDATARLAVGVSLEDAQSELTVIAANLAEAYPTTNRGWGIVVSPLSEAVTGDARPALLVLLGAVGFVLLLACANVTSLLLVRAWGRNREMAVRSALGASRLRLVRQLLLESIVLSLTGGAMGLALAALLLRVITRFAPESIPRIDEVTLDPRVIGFAVLATLIAGIASGLAPAFHGSATSPTESLRGGSGSVSSDRRRHRLRAAIVIAEVAAAVLLLVGAGLFLQSFDRVTRVELGFDADRLLVVRMRLDGATYGGGGAHPYYERFLGDIRALPGVVAVGGTTGLPMDALDTDFERPFWRQGEPRPEGGGPGVQIRMATTGYFDAMRIPLLAGREVDPFDDRTKPRVAIVNETMARQTWPGESAVGKSVSIDYQSYEAAYEVVGVVGDTRFYGHRQTPRRAVYIPHQQNPYLPLNIVVRTEGDPEALAQSVRALALEIDPAQPVHSTQTMAELMGGHLERDRFAAFLMSVLAATALLLATIGVYGVVAFSVSQRERELGLRLALGAGAGDVMRLVLAGGLRIGVAGALLGTVLAVVGSRYVESSLFGISPTDPATLAAAAAVLVATVLAACYVPARRAAAVDPTETLRSD